jgi:hypothetical protein
MNPRNGLNYKHNITRATNERIDKERGDINRSKYVLRLLERAYQNHRAELAKKSEGQVGR